MDTMSQLQRLIRKLRPRSPASPDHSTSESRRFFSSREVLGDDELDFVCIGANAGIPQRPVIPPKEIHTACKEGNLEAVRRLLDRGANVDGVMRENGETPLLIVATLGDLPIVKLLSDYGANLNMRGEQDVLWVAGVEASSTSLQSDEAEMLDAYAMNAPLTQACREGHLDVVQELIKRGCDINVQNGNGNTSLHVSCLGRTFYPYSTSRSQYVPSTFFLQPNLEIIEELLLHGARTDVLNHDGQTAIQRLSQVRCRPSLQMMGWQFTRRENNNILINIFKAFRLLLQYGCNLPRSFWLHHKHYHDIYLSEEILVMVKFAENFGLLPDVYPVILDTLLLSLDSGCKFSPYDVLVLRDYDPDFQLIVDVVHPMVSCPRPLLGQCRTFIRSLLGSLHKRLTYDVVSRLDLPRSLTQYILGERQSGSSHQ